MSGILGATPFRRGRRVEDVAQDLRNSAEHTTEAIGEAQRGYRKMNENLAALRDAVSQLAGRSERLAELAGGRDYALAHIELGATLVETFFSRIADLQAMMENQTLGLRDGLDCIRQLLRGERNLADAIAPLEYIQVMLKIEAARLPIGHQEVFSDLSKEIAEVCLSARTSCTTGIESLSKLDDTFGNTIEAAEQRLDEKRQFIDSGRKEIAEALKRLSSDLSLKASKPAEIRSASACLLQDTDRALLIVKRQDTISRSLDRVYADLLAAADAGSSERQGLPATHADELTSLIKEAADAHREIAAISNGLTNRLPGTESGQAIETADSIDHAMGALLDSFARAQSLLSDASASIRDVGELIVPLESRAVENGSSVQQISALMKLIALNGQIHAIKIGNGTGLEILAAHTSAISVATTEIGVATGKVSVKLAELVEAAWKRTTELKAAFDAADAWMKDEAGAAEELLRGFHATVHGEKRELTSSLRHAHEAADNLALASDQTLMQHVIDELSQRVPELEALADRRYRKPKWLFEIANLASAGKRALKQTMWNWSGRRGFEARAASARTK